MSRLTISESGVMQRAVFGCGVQAIQWWLRGRAVRATRLSGAGEIAVRAALTHTLDVIASVSKHASTFLCKFVLELISTPL